MYSKSGSGIISIYSYQKRRALVPGHPGPAASGGKRAINREEMTMMKKTTFGAALAFLAVAAGVLTAVALYLRRREKELDEYERLLYSDDGDYDEDTIYEPIGDDEGDQTEEQDPDAADAEDGDVIKF